jgi:hypothetical protein
MQCVIITMELGTAGCTTKSDETNTNDSWSSIGLIGFNSWSFLSKGLFRGNLSANEEKRCKLIRTIVMMCLCADLAINGI